MPGQLCKCPSKYSLSPMITNTCATCKRKFPEKRGNILIFAGNLDIFQQNDPQITDFTGYKLAYFASSLPQIQENPPNNPDSSSSVQHLPGAFCWVPTAIPCYAVERPDKPIADPKTGKAWIGPSDLKNYIISFRNDLGLLHFWKDKTSDAGEKEGGFSI